METNKYVSHGCLMTPESSEWWEHQSNKFSSISSTGIPTNCWAKLETMPKFKQSKILQQEHTRFQIKWQYFQWLSHKLAKSPPRTTNPSEYIVSHSKTKKNPTVTPPQHQITSLKAINPNRTLNKQQSWGYAWNYKKNPSSQTSETIETPCRLL